MNLKHFLSRLPINKASRFNGRITPSWNYREVTTTRCISPLLHVPNCLNDDSRIRNPKTPITRSLFSRFIHSGSETVSNVTNAVSTLSVDSEDDENALMNEFLSRFVWIMRGKLTDVYTEADKKEIDAMLQIIVGKVISVVEAGQLESLLDSDSVSSTMSQDFSEDIWKTVWEVSNVVIEDMENAKKKEKMKSFLQCEEVKDMTRFAGEIGIRGDLLRELRFKWAREKLEDSEFYDYLELLKQESKEESETTQIHNIEEEEEEEEEEDNNSEASLPKRTGKIKYKIYGLDLSKPKWEKVAEQIQENVKSVFPQEPKPISGKSKIITEKLLSLQEHEDPSPLISQWKELLQPTRVDWLSLLDKLKQQNHQLYFKVSEILLDEQSFQTTIRDYSHLTEQYAKNNDLQKAESIINKMTEKGITPDILTKTTMVHMYSKSGNLTLAKQSFEALKALGFQPDLKVYNSMIMAYITANDRKSSESLLRDLESKSLKPSESIFLALLKSYAENGDPVSADRIATRMGFAGYPPTLQSCMYLVEANSRKGNPDTAKKHFDDIIKLGYKPDDSCIARMISAYANKNLLDKALQLLLQLEKEGVEHGVETYTVLIDWFGKLQLVDEVEGILGKLTEKGVDVRESVGVVLSLCDMYARGRDEKKALQMLGVLECNIGKLKGEDFERVINGLVVGGFRKDAERVHELMKGKGFTVSEGLSVTLQAAQTFRRRPGMMR